MKNKSILVTGGAGMIGSNLVKKLASLGYDVHVYDNLWRGRLKNLLDEKQEAVIDLRTNFKKLDLAKCDLTKIKHPFFEAVIHLADVVAGIRYVFQNEHEIFNQNLRINTNLFSWVKTIRPRTLIYVGTACSFPKELQNGLTAKKLREEQLYPAHPESAYGWSKLMGTYECELLSSETNIRVVNLIFHNVYGTPCDVGPRSQFIPATCLKIKKYPKENLVVWGSGKQQRAFLHVQDAVRAILLGLDKGHDQGPIQIGPSQASSIRGIVKKLIKISKKKIEPTYNKKMPEGDKSRAADLTKAKKILGWQPEVPLDQGLQDVYEWVCRQKN